MIFILDRQERVINILKNNGGANDTPPFFDDILTEDLQTGAETFQFSTVGMGDVSRDLVVGNFVAFEKNGKFKMFQIMSTEETHEDVVYITVYCECAGLELINKVFRKRKINSATLRTFLTTVLEDTGWNVGGVPLTSVNTIDLDLEDSTVYGILQEVIPQFNGEMEFRVEIKNGRVSKKFIDVYTTRGRVTGKRFVFGQDIEGLTRKIDSTNLYTALIGKGKNGLTFKDITVQGIDKPLGQDFVGNQDSFDRYNHNGYHVMGIFEYDTESPEELLRETYKELEKCKEPRFEYEISVALLGNILGEKWNSVSIGDTVAIVDHAMNPPIQLMARVSKLETSFTNSQADTCTLSNFVEVQSNITSQMRKIASELEGYVDSSIGNRFPIQSDDIGKDAITGDKIHEYSITADKILAGEIKATHIDATTMTVESGVFDNLKVTDAMMENVTIDSAKIDMAEITNAVVQDLKVGTAQIEDLAVTTAKVKELDAGKIKSGYIEAERIKAGSISADKVLIGANTNIVSNPNFAGGNVGESAINWLSSVEKQTKVVVTGAPSSTNAICFNNTSAVSITATQEYQTAISNGEQLYISYETTSDRNNGQQFGVAIYDKNNKLLQTVGIASDNANGVWIKKTGTITINNANASYVRPWISIPNKLGDYWLTSLQITKKTGSTLIENGAITTEKIDANAITSNLIKGSVVEAINLKATNAVIDSAKIGNLDASKITTGTLNADRIATGSISADKVVIGDTSNINKLSPSNNPGGLTVITHEDGTKYFKTSGDGYVGMTFVKSPTVDFSVGDEYIFELIGYKTNSFSTTAFIRYYYEGEPSFVNAGSINIEFPLNTPGSAKTTVKITTSVDTTKKLKHVGYFIEKGNGFGGSFYVKDVKIYKKVRGELIVNGAITTDKLHANAITTDLLKASVISAINISTESAKINSAKISDLSADKITAGDISADRLQASVISAINSYSGTAKIKQAQIQALSVGNANITDLDASKIKTGKIDAERIDVAKITIGEGQITGTLSASKISGGTLDASKITVKNLKADSITAGSITVQGENLLHNTALEKDTAGWNVWSRWKRDTSFKFEGVNTFKCNAVGLTANNWEALMTERVPVEVGDVIVGSVYVYCDDLSTIDNGCSFEFQWYADKTSSRLPNQTGISIKPTQAKTWQRFVYSYQVREVGTKYVDMRFHPTRNGVFYIAKPMLSKGTIASIWKPHTDELISDGAIDNDKLGNESVSSEKINTNELFVGDNAFIKKLKAVEIDAGSITTGKISSERIDINGLVSFESLDKNLKPIFNTTGDKTYINGGFIGTNTIQANSIDLYSGLSVRGEDNTTTFAIASNGEVEVNGLLKSGNFDEDKNTGYKLSTDGKAVLNQAIVKGDVILPSAGMTNFGGAVGNPNLVQNSWFNGSTSNAYGFGGRQVTGGLKNNTTYTFTVNGRSNPKGNTEGKYLQCYIYENSWNYGSWSFAIKETSDTTKSITFTTGNSIEGKNVTINFYWYPSGGDRTGDATVNWCKLEEGSLSTPWCPHSSEQFNHVRMWAGSSYENRNNARFRVYDNGDVYASNGTFTGTLIGRLDSGDVQIEQNEITINSPGTETNIIKFSASENFINSNLILGSVGDQRITYSNSNRNLEMKNVGVYLKGTYNDISMAKNGGWNTAFRITSTGSGTSANVNQGFTNGTTWANTMIFSHGGNKGSERYGDICFRRESDVNEDIDISIEGNLKVHKVESSKTAIELRSVANEGWGFYAN